MRPGKPGEPRRPRNANAKTDGAAPVPPPRVTPGPRPLGPRQRALQQEAEADRRQKEQVARLGREAASVSPAPAAPPPGPASKATAPGRRTRRHVRDAETTRRRAMRRNRRVVRWAPVLLQIACGLFTIECVAALLFSPRLRVQTVTVTGNDTVPAGRLLKRMGRIKEQNIVRLPTHHITDAVLAEPTVETAEVRREWPDRVTLVVHERTPWASVQTPDGVCYTIDAGMVPFRTGDTPEDGLPRLRLAPAPDGRAPTVTLGKPMTAPGLNEVSRCLAWATARPDFALDAVTIDSEGKLCLNRKGDVEIQLGTGSDLNKKLASLELLLERRPGLRTGTDVAYVNLYAYDAPAIMPRPILPPTTTLTPSESLVSSEVGGVVEAGKTAAHTPRRPVLNRASSRKLVKRKPVR